MPGERRNSNVGNVIVTDAGAGAQQRDGAASTTLLRLFHCGGLRLVVWWAHSAVSTGAVMALAMTSARWA